MTAHDIHNRVVSCGAQEYKMKRDKARENRLKRARIPESLVMETFPFEHQPKLDKQKIFALYESFDYMAKSQNIIWIGPTGCGKTGLATGFLIQAIHRGYTGRYIEFPELVEELSRSVENHSEDKVIKRYLAYDCLVIDDVGHVEAEPAEMGLFFTLIDKRHKRKPTLITSNLSFCAWRSFLKNDDLTAALIDQVTKESHVINMTSCITVRPKLELSRSVVERRVSSDERVVPDPDGSQRQS
jgi:DNA replication protein DnaC